MAGKEFNIISGDRILLVAEANSKQMQISAVAQVEDNISESTTLAPSSRAVKAGLEAANSYTDQKIGSMTAPVYYKGILDKESSLPQTTDVPVGSFFEVKELDTTSPGYSGRAIWNGTTFDIIKDNMRAADNTTISFRESDGALELNPSWVDKINNKVDKNGTDRLITEAEASKLAGIEAGAEANKVDSVAGKTGEVTLVKADVGLANVDNTADLAKPISTATQGALDGKVDKVDGKGLSTEDFTAADKAKLAAMVEGAEVNQNAYSVLKFDDKTISATAKLDTFNFVAGSDILFEVDEANKTVTIKANRDTILEDAITTIKVNDIVL